MQYLNVGIYIKKDDLKRPSNSADDESRTHTGYTPTTPSK